MNRPLVSVVIPTVDKLSFLNRAIASVLNQTYAPLEIIVVIDGTSEKTVRLIEERNEKLETAIRFYETGQKVGGSEARNIGVRHAKAEYIALLDDDDEWFNDKIASQMELVQGNHFTEKDDFLCFTSLENDKKKTRKGSAILPYVNYRGSGKKRIADYLFETKGFRHIGFIQTSTILVPKRLLLETPFTKGLVKHQDWDWLLRLDEHYPPTVIQVEEPKVIYHSDAPNDNRVTYKNRNRWRFSETWALAHQDSFSKAGYDSFLLEYVLLVMAGDESLPEDEKRKEMLKRIKTLSIRNIARPFTWKIIVYHLRRR